jgi:hypothetical protein
VALIAAILTLFIFARLSAPERVVGPNTPVRFDDFDFSVTGVKRVPMDKSAGTYLVVRLHIQNHAKVVPFQFLRSTAFVVDDAGRQFGVSAEGQAYLDRRHGTTDPCAGKIPPGGECTTVLAFDVPEDAVNPRLKLAFGGPVGEFLDTMISGRTRIKLEAQKEP